jgi:hypothetical protein
MQALDAPRSLRNGRRVDYSEESLVRNGVIFAMQGDLSTDQLDPQRASKAILVELNSLDEFEVFEPISAEQAAALRKLQVPILRTKLDVRDKIF